MKIVKLDELKKKVEMAIAACSGVKAMLSGSEIIIMNAGTTQKRHRRTKAEIEEATKAEGKKKVSLPKKVVSKTAKKVVKTSTKKSKSPGEYVKTKPTPKETPATPPV